ncbi:MAG: Uncharacterized protein G01um101431_937 [Parcubacteria group bacterium Gr01-1014_31]|nr:MAG: Uncharacterized protein G01um101431_937 [Parcubacteria group bacterium Gr01-1014_31]
MPEAEIKKRINFARSSGSENSHTEFKDARGGLPGDIWRAISSFSHNPEGGLIVFGIKELVRKDGIREISIVGLRDIAQLQEKIVAYFRDVMVNAEIPELKVFPYEGKNILAVIIRHVPDERKPCYNKQIGLPHGACIRVGNTSRSINFEELKQFIRNSALYKYDKEPALDTNIKMLSREKIKKFLATSASKTDRKVDGRPTYAVMKNLGIVVQIRGRDVPTVGGFLIFSRELPQKTGAFYRFMIRCVKYNGINSASPIGDKLDIAGTLDQQIDEIQKFILRNIPVAAKIVGTKRVEEYEYPEEALREIVANAIIHRDYMITETYTQVNIFSNRIEISNPGNLPPGVSVENIKQAQFSRNEVIASILKDMDYLEEYGRGIDIVLARMHERGLPEPIFKNMANNFKVVLPGRKFLELNRRQLFIWNTLQDRLKMTAKECQQLFPKVSRATISNDLNKLDELGLVSMRGSGASTFYEIQ